MIQVDIGIFAYNEEKCIPWLLENLANQSIIRSNQIDVRIYLLANGCKDQTVSICKRLIHSTHLKLTPITEIHNLLQGGKSRTWNHFTHSLARTSSDTLVYMDADIRLKSPYTLEELALAQFTSSHLKVVCSKPIKDIADTEQNLNLIEKLILSGGGTSENWKKSICGQLYAVQAKSARQIHMPIGLPVEDGFLRAMLLTNLLTEPEDTSIIDGFDNISHEYESIRNLTDLISHQVRIIIGGAINSSIFRHIEERGGTVYDNKQLLEEASKNEYWLSNVVKSTYPRRPYGYVPFHYAIKRLRTITHDKLISRKAAVCIAGFGFDLLIWIIASCKMFRGKGVGYW